MKHLALLLTLVSASCGFLYAQDTTCNSGDIAWVSSAVNANVGLASGGGRCSSNTVAGANYNDPLVPFGIQAALDCVCNGSLIHILGDGNYGSATASWNNRFDASKKLRTVNNSTNPGTPLIGYVDSSTGCRDSNTPAGCPITLDFAGGTGLGIESANTGYAFFGLRIQNSATTGLTMVAGNIAGGLEITGNGGWGVDMNSTLGASTIFLGRSLISENGTVVANTGGVRARTRAKVGYNSVVDNTGSGVQIEGELVSVYFNLIQNTVGQGVALNNSATVIYGNTIRGSSSNGIGQQVSGSSTNSFGASLFFNLIAENGGWGINEASHSTRSAGVLYYNVLGDNSSGDINTTNIPAGTFVFEHGNITGATIVFVSATDSNVVSGAELELTYPSGNTPLIINAGAIPDGGSGGGSGGGLYVPVGSR